MLIFTHLSNNTSSAPFVNIIFLPSILYLELISFLSESNATSSSLLYLFLNTFSSDLYISLYIYKSAYSVGSPIPLPSLDIAESLLSIALYNNRLSAVLSPDISYMSCTVILFCVSVPVLSEHITDTQPKDSTADKFLIIACSLAIFCVPIACTIVTIELNASGIAATASATANKSESISCMPFISSATNTTAHITSIPAASHLLKLSRLLCSGVFFCPVSFIREAIFPISVSIAVDVTTTSARPYVTRLPEYTILILSANGVSS